MNKKFKIIICIVLALIILIGGYLTWYVNDYYHAEPSVNALLNGSENVTVTKIDNGLFLDGPGNESALIFYPGAKIEYTSYLPMLMDLANDGVDCFLVEMPFNLAVLDTDSADSIIDSGNYTYERYYMSGHSLGGSISASYIKNHPNKVDGLILLAAYSPDDLGDFSVLSIYGSNDKNLNKVTYDESLDLIDGNLTEYVIEGGNHAQFASYGIDKKDGKATISPEEQKNITEEQILKFIN
jgi:hypothetical protein